MSIEACARPWWGLCERNMLSGLFCFRSDFIGIFKQFLFLGPFEGPSIFILFIKLILLYGGLDTSKICSAKNTTKTLKIVLYNKVELYSLIKID